MATVSIVFTPSALWPAATAQPEMVNIAGTNNPVIGWAFADSADEAIYTEAFRIANYGSGAITAIVHWYSRTGQTSGVAVWEVAFQALSPGAAQSVETDGFATAANGTSTVNGTARGLVQFVNNAFGTDSVASGYECVCRIRRLGTNGSDTLTGDAILTCLTLTYSDT